jgi:alkylation response protein AidB-like acyl-CoA dehydrogenase
VTELARTKRLLLLDTLSEAWRRCLDGKPDSLEQKADLLLAAAHAMSSAVQAVELTCSIAGTTAFRATNPVERCFRDVETMRHHVFASEQRYGTFWRVYLGVPPDFPVVAFSVPLILGYGLMPPLATGIIAGRARRA